MCFDEMLPSPLSNKCCVGGPSHCCMFLVIRYSPLSFPLMLLVLLLVCYIVNVDIVVDSLC